MREHLAMDIQLNKTHPFTNNTYQEYPYLYPIGGLVNKCRSWLLHANQNGVIGCKRPIRPRVMHAVRLPYIIRDLRLLDTDKVLPVLDELPCVNDHEHHR